MHKTMVFIMLALISVSILCYPIYALENIPQQLIVNTNVWIVLGGLGEIGEHVEKLVKENYTCTLSSELNLSIDIHTHFVMLNNISGLERILNHDSNYTTIIPKFMLEYIEYFHPEWNISKVQLVRADLFERDAWNYLVLNKIIPSDADYVLLIFYLPPEKGVLRTYYVQRYISEVGGYRNLTGFINFGGNTPLYFIDLSAIPRNWPTTDLPLHWAGMPVDPIDNPPLWDINSKEEAIDLIKRYIEGYIGFLVARPLFWIEKAPYPLWAPSYVVNITIFNFGHDHGSVEKLLRTIITGELKHMLESYTPYSHWEINISVINGNRTPLVKALQFDLRKTSSCTALNVSLIEHLLIANNYPNTTYSDNKLVFPVYILVGDKPLCLYYGEMNFTGAAFPGVFVILTYPGYMNRILDLGMDMAIAHEIGHMLGLPHPFERETAVDNAWPVTSRGYAMWWFFDFTVTPMSYAPTLIGWTGGLFYYDTKSLARYTAAYLLRKSFRENHVSSLLLIALDKLRKDKTLGLDGAVYLLLNLEHEYTSTITTTATYTLTTTITKNKTITKTITTTLPLTITEKTTITKTRTITFINTRAYTVTINNPSMFSPEFLFVMGIILIVSVTAIIIFGTRKYHV